MCKKWICFTCLLSTALGLFAQEEKEEEMLKGAHRITTGLGHTHISKGKNVDGKTVWLLQPSWSLNYDYWIVNKWAIGLQSDLVLEKFIVKDDSGEDLERENPWAVIPLWNLQTVETF